MAEAVDCVAETLRYKVDDFPPPVLALLLTLQLLVVVTMPLVYPVLVLKTAHWPMADIRNALSWGLLALALGTWLQSLRGPVGSGFLCPPLSSAIYLQPSLAAVHLGGPALYFGMTLYAGALETAFASVVRRVRFLFPGEVCGLIVLLVGIEIGTSGVAQLMDFTDAPLADFGLHALVVLASLLLLVGFTVWGGLYLKNSAPILAILGGTLLAVTLLPPSAEAKAFVGGTPWVDLPGPPRVEWAFHPAMVLPFTAAALAAGLRTVGVTTTLQQLADPHWHSPDYRTIAGAVRADGLGAMASAMVGSMGSSSSPSAVGVSTACGIMSRRLGSWVAAGLVLLAFMPRPLAYLCTAPSAVVAALLLFYSCFMMVGGFRLIGRQNLDLRATFVLGMSLALALGTGLVKDPMDASLPGWLRPMAHSMLSVGLLSALVLTALFRLGIHRSHRFQISPAGEGAPEEVSTDVADAGQDLGARPEAGRDAARLAATVVRQIHDRRLADGPVEVVVDYDRVNLALEFRYRGRPLSLHPSSRPRHEDLVDENVFAMGLSSYMDEVRADEYSVHVEGERVRLRLAFATG